MNQMVITLTNRFCLHYHGIVSGESGYKTRVQQSQVELLILTCLCLQTREGCSHFIYINEYIDSNFCTLKHFSFPTRVLQ